jgi:hypothetical protein
MREFSIQKALGNGYFLDAVREREVEAAGLIKSLSGVNAIFEICGDSQTTMDQKAAILKSLGDALMFRHTGYSPERGNVIGVLDPEDLSVATIANEVSLALWQRKFIAKSYLSSNGDIAGMAFDLANMATPQPIRKSHEETEHDPLTGSTSGRNEEDLESFPVRQSPIASGRVVQSEEDEETELFREANRIIAEKGLCAECVGVAFWKEYDPKVAKQWERIMTMLELV